MEPIELMKEAMKTFEERDQMYGKTYLEYGLFMKQLFPVGIELKSVDDFCRMGVLNMVISKILRYANNWDEPHKDSIHDLGVYAFILESIDDNIRSRNDRTS
jgi:hypothetical protein